MRVGVDLVAVDAVRDALALHAERYLARVYSEREVADCTYEGVVAPERLAARFAAKEAALKVVRRGDEGVGWRCVEVVRDEAGWVRLALSGRAESLAAEAGVSELALSLTHEGGLAVAVVVAEVARPDGPGGGT